MLISGNSPLRRLPESLNPQQINILDGLRVSLDIVSYAYDNLIQSLLTISLDIGKQNRADLIPVIFMNAWSIIDFTNRAKVLLDRFRDKKPTGITEIDSFFSDYGNVLRKMRNDIQHLDERIIDEEIFLKTEKPVIGSLAWIYTPLPYTGQLYSHMAIPGSMRKIRSEYIINPAGQEISSQIDHVTFYSIGKEVNLKNLHDSLEKVVFKIEKVIEPQFQNIPTLQADVILTWSSVPEIQVAD